MRQRRNTRVRRQTHWATGFSSVAAELQLTPLNGTTGGTYNAALDFTSSGVISAEGGEGMVVARIVGSFVPHFMSTTVDGTPMDRGGVLRLGFARVFQANAGAIAFPDLFDNEDLGSEDIMWTRQHIMHKLEIDTYSGAGVAYPNDVRGNFVVQAGLDHFFGRAGAADEKRDFDISTKRRVDANQTVMLLMQARQWPGFGPPDPDLISLEFTAYARMLVLHALNR